MLASRLISFSILTASLLLLSSSVALSSFSSSGNTTNSTHYVNWQYYGNDLGNERFQNLNQINTSNVGNLKVAWVFHTGVLDPHSSFEVSPIIVNGVVYVTSPHDDVFALNATSGAELWSYHPRLPPESFFVNEGAVIANRGVAYGNGMVFIATIDDHLIALNAMSGKVVWKITIANYQSGYYESMAPLFVNGMILIGNSGGDVPNHPSGFLEARSATTGSLFWKFTPVDPTTWSGNSARTAGVAIWGTPVVNPSEGLVFVNTGNPSSDFNGHFRAGTNLYADSVVALKLSTGQLVWYFQSVHHDLWDYDIAQALMLFYSSHTGSATASLGACNKDGNYFILDQENGNPIFPVTEQPVPTHPAWQHPWPTQPISSVQSFTPISVHKPYPNNDTPVQEFTPVTTHPQLYQPEADGGCEWPSAAYSPLTGYVYFGTSYFPEEAVANESNTQAFGSTLVSPVPGIPPRADYGIFGATNVNTGQVAWTDKVPQPAVSGMVVGGSLVFFGESNGRFVAANSQSGQILWSFNSNSVKNAGGANAQPAIYVSNGVEYVINAFGGNAGDRSAGIDSPLGDAIIAFTVSG